MIARRNFIKSLAVAAGAVATGCSAPKSNATNTDNFIYCLNTSTIRGQKLGLLKEIEITAQAGFDAIEIWNRSIQDYLQNGGSIQELTAALKNSGLTVEDGMGFVKWISPDETVRQQALAQAKKEMDLLASIGCTRMAAPPMGAVADPVLNLDKVAERYYDLLQAGKQSGVTPLIELWGFSKNLSKLGEVMYVASQCGHPNASVLLDVYHLHRGGNNFNGLKMINGAQFPMIHLNDYPGDIVRENLKDSHRVYPGDGVAPYNQIIKDLHSKGTRMVLSLELFSKKYWEQDALLVAQTGLQKMKNVVKNALSA